MLAAWNRPRTEWQFQLSFDSVSNQSADVTVISERCLSIGSCKLITGVGVLVGVDVLVGSGVLVGAGVAVCSITA